MGDELASVRAALAAAHVHMGQQSSELMAGKEREAELKSRLGLASYRLADLEAERQDERTRMAAMIAEMERLEIQSEKERLAAVREAESLRDQLAAACWERSIYSIRTPLAPDPASGNKAAEPPLRARWPTSLRARWPIDSASLRASKPAPPWAPREGWGARL